MMNAWEREGEGDNDEVLKCTSGSDDLRSPGTMNLLDEDTDESLETGAELRSLFKYSDVSRILNGNPQPHSTYLPSMWFLSVCPIFLICGFFGC